MRARYRYGGCGIDSMHEGNRALAGCGRDRQVRLRMDGGTQQGTARMRDKGAMWMRAGMDRHATWYVRRVGMSVHAYTV